MRISAKRSDTPSPIDKPASWQDIEFDAGDSREGGPHHRTCSLGCSDDDTSRTTRAEQQVHPRGSGRTNDEIDATEEPDLIDERQGCGFDRFQSQPLNQKSLLISMYGARIREFERSFE